MRHDISDNEAKQILDMLARHVGGKAVKISAVGIYVVKPDGEFMS